MESKVFSCHSCCGRLHVEDAPDAIGMNRKTPIPQQLDKFWVSGEKQNLQLLVCDLVRFRACGDSTIPSSSLVSNNEVLPAKAAATLHLILASTGNGGNLAAVWHW